jgi:hypothetical protein
MFWLGLATGFVGGGAAVWFGKEPLTLWYKGAEDYAGGLMDRARTVRDKLK